MRYYLKPLSYLYEQIVGVKNSLYNRGVISVYKAPVPVISIGNLTVGGTGKTPITDFCLKSLVADGKKVAVVSRSYRADASEPTPVDVTHPFAARYYGDEPVLLAQANPDVRVYVGDSKWRTAQFAVSHGQYDVLIVDDGFQHRKLARDLNIVILDATETLSNYEVVPEGRGRESWEGLGRADVIVLSKCNLTSEDHLKALEARIPKGKEVLYFGYDIKTFNHRHETKTAEEMRGKKLFLVSAIARPDVFEKMMRNVGDVSKKSIHYRDHHQYTQNDAHKIWDEFQKSQCDYLITTGKDAVKLSHLMPDGSTLWSSSLEVAELGKKGRLHEIISQLLC
ncbi:MAG: tetraacyldisaccharide 4'-kinase [Bdellovibrio sp.]|nr:tetraacyldisaccharide 4'-kinase [Bdellovibrio sp.]